MNYKAKLRIIKNIFLVFCKSSKISLMIGHYNIKNIRNCQLITQLNITNFHLPNFCFQFLTTLQQLFGLFLATQLHKEERT